MTYFKLIKQRLFQYNFIINSKCILFLVLLIPSYLFSQPPPPCEANGNNGFGGAVGEGFFLYNGEGNNPMTFGMTTNSNGMNDILVLYFDTGIPGRNVLDIAVDDNTDEHTIAISNSDAFGHKSVIQFPPGFEASFAVAINAEFGGLWSIPNTGTVGTGDLEFITSVNSTLETVDQHFYQFSFNWETIGLTIVDSFDFVGLYVSSTAFSSDEGYGAGITAGTEDSDPITFNGYLTLPGCIATLSTIDHAFNNITAYYVNGQLFVKGINDVATISVYDIQGRELYTNDHIIDESVPIVFDLTINELLFIVIESAGRRTVLKVVPN